MSSSKPIFYSIPMDERYEIPYEKPDINLKIFLTVKIKQVDGENFSWGYVQGPPQRYFWFPVTIKDDKITGFDIPDEIYKKYAGACVINVEDN